MMKKNFKNKLVGCMVVTTLVGILAVPSLAQVGQKMAYLNYNNMKVTLNGQTLNLKDSNGNPVEPFTIDGTTYLPLASVSQALGVNVAWDGNTNTVALTTSSAGNTTTPTQNIGMDQAKEIALKHAGLSASQATFFKTMSDWEDGKQIYDIEFYSGNKEYDYEIDMTTGTILSYDYDIEGYVNTPAQSSNDIGADKAKEIALNHAGVAASNAVFLTAKLDRDDGRRVYDVEFYSGNKEYDYEIDAADGSILSFDYDVEGYTPDQNTSTSSGSYISEAAAKKIVEQKAGTTGTYREFKLDRDDGRAVYEGELRSGTTEYDFTIDATTGTILEWDVDRT